MTTQAWEYKEQAFADFGQKIAANLGRNLLARRGVKFVPGPSCPSEGRHLTDGRAGQMGEEGRVFLDGRPTVISYYLGEPKTIKEVGVWSFNCDTRSNQDFEVRLFDNSRLPGQMPQFRSQPDLTSGDKVLGQNHGGWLTRFADKQGGPLAPGKADWVQFRIWGTHTAEAGDAAKTRKTLGAGVLVELEVLGEEGDVVLPTKEELARREALEKIPKQPEFIKKVTWQETLIASREALLAWETLQDSLALPEAGASLGPWYVLGPLPAKSEVLQQVRSETRIDLSKRYPVKDGNPVGWEKCADIQDGRLVDLTDYRGSGKGDVLLLCRPVTLDRVFERNQLAVSISADQGRAEWLPPRRGLGVLTPAVLCQEGQELAGEPGEYQLLITLHADKDGRRRVYFQPQSGSVRPGAGTVDSRRSRRQQWLNRVRQEFAEPADQLQIRWDLEDGLWGNPARNTEDWLPGHVDVYLKKEYQRGFQRRLNQLTAAITTQSVSDAAIKTRSVSEATSKPSVSQAPANPDTSKGIRGMVIAAVQPRLEAWLAQFKEASDGGAATKPASLSTETVEQLRNRSHHFAAVQELISIAAEVRSMRMSVEDQRDTFRERYPNAPQFLARVGLLEKEVTSAWDDALGDAGKATATVIALRKRIDEAAQEILLSNPLLAFDKLLLVRGGAGFASNWGGPNRLGNEIAVLSPVRPDGKLTSLHKGGSVSDMDLHWDGDRVLFSDGRFLNEIRTDGSGLRRITQDDQPVTHYDGCYLPDGKIVCVSDACEQAVPCTGGGGVGNLHIIDGDGKNERRVAYDQDHNWNPVVMHDGRVLYSRWEYVDLPHYFSRMLFRMNPDGSGQMEYYGSNSYWPNAMYWPRPIPGHPTMIVCVVSGHHGVSRVGELVLLDPARGRFEADGAVQRIPGYGVKVEPIIQDNLVGDSWPKFATPWPLAEPDTDRGAGKYFLVSVQRDEHAPWDLCLVDIFDNITPILRGDGIMPIPLRPRLKPPAIPSHLDLTRKDGLVYLADVYQGDGLRGYPRGSIKALRIGSHHYRYAGNGDTRASSYEGGWDVKKILGTVPVEEDGSALFRVPANTPIFVQPLDAEGKAQQQMRSWYTAMPGETASCVGCHERQNSGPPSHPTMAAMRKPSQIAAWNGPARGFSFDREVQPVLDRRCVGCHNGQPCKVGDRTLETADLRAKRLHADYLDNYSPAYMALQKYVRRAGYESDNHMHSPAEFEPDTSSLVQMLKKGHYGVRLDRDEWDRLYTWIDLNIPYALNWRESHRPPQDEQIARRVKYKKLFSAIDDRDEDPLPLPAIAAYEPPSPSKPRPVSIALAGWPMSSEDAKQLQKSSGSLQKEVELPGGEKMKFVPIPAGQFVMGDARGFDDECVESVVRIERPFYLGQFEVTNRQYAAFDARHDSAYVEGRGKDRTTRGTPINAPDLPVVRISWNQAMAFCRWLSDTTGCHATLPTEAQWEWACRAGTATAFQVGDAAPGMRPFANLADGSAAGWNYGRAEPGYQDGVQFTAAGGRFPANAWGLLDMHGNVAEWCASAYRPYPYNAKDGREDPRQPGPRVVRGGSWNDTFRFSTNASRWRYQPHQPVYNVGFRVLLEVSSEAAVAAK